VAIGKTRLQALVPALLCSAPLWAQAPASPNDAGLNAGSREQPEEVIVRGRRLADFRAELRAARIRVYDLFNDLNSDDAFDVQCRTEDSTGTRMRQQTCRPQFKDNISAAAASAWVHGIEDACGSQLTQDCMFNSGGPASLGKSMALAEESWEPVMQQRFAVEMARVVRDNPEMQQAIVDYEAVERAYQEARNGKPKRGCGGADPPPRCSR
jgi:hypothetical protein